MTTIHQPKSDSTIPPDEDSEPADIATITAPAAACAGEDPPDDHPLVYLPIGPKGEAICPYCSRRFRLAKGVPPGPLGH